MNSALERRERGLAAPQTSNGMGQALLSMLFDGMRFQYASAVTAGLIQRSILASGKLERTLDTLEKLILGPLARQR